MKRKNVCVVILNWNNWKDTIECIESLSVVTRQETVAVIIVDNASSDNSWEKIHEWINERSEAANIVHINDENKLHDGTEWEPELKYILIQSDKNRGYAGGNNLGIRAALRYFDCEFIWVLNNDTVVDKNTIEALLGCALIKPDVGMWGSTIVEYGQPNMVQCAGGASYTPLLSLNRPFLKGAKLDDALNYGAEADFQYIAGSAIFMKADMVKKVGLFNEDYFLYYEEIDYANRAKQHGYQLDWCRKSIVLHKGGASIGSISAYNEKKSEISEYCSNLSALKYTSKFHPLLFPFVFALRLLLKAVHHIAYGNYYLLVPLIFSYLDYILMKKGCLYKRYINTERKKNSLSGNVKK